jgi:rhodanese-related sulfurtransferase
LWEQFEENETPTSYQRMLDYFDVIVPEGMRDWFKAYMINNEPVYFYEFEQSPPPFVTENPSPTNRSTNTSQNLLLTWEINDRANYDLNFDVFLGELNATESPLEAVYTRLPAPSQAVALKPDTQYIWRIKAYDDQGNEYISPVWFFTTGNDEQEEPFCTDVTVSQARNIINDNAGNDKFIIIDVRTLSEYNSGHIENAVNVNYYDDFEVHIDAYERNYTYLVYCGSGGRSRNAVNKMFNDMGFTKIYHMYQGYSSW